MDSLLSNFQNLLSQNLVLAILISYLTGILASVTPCIYPMIPVTIGVIGSQKVTSKWQAFLLSLTYVGGLSIVYSILGIIAASTGIMFGHLSTNPWLFLIIGNLCLFFGAWMMGWINIPQIGLLNTHKWQENKSFLTVFIMGAISGLVAAPCTTPILAILLGYVATTGSIIKGGILMFSFSFGMGTFLIILGTFVGLAKTVPKPGTWMVRVKQAFAIIIIIGGEYFLIKMGQLLF
jgi:cytochrome c-type biogenesis protein